ncbi:hypothetical protein AOQ84DRAFT_441739 [Glonium stellatum]|uniref:Uncharacterized protein n=1 Tax=Glonium stellatum TaxID=574774 RepID=A0A8E2EUL8_9PEZI|nr:hypothetical protein AOQ84DRAFT_441739 [Glonium stellatum]
MDTQPDRPFVNQKIVPYNRYGLGEAIACIQVTDHTLTSRLFALGRSHHLKYNSMPPPDAEFSDFAVAQTWVMFLPAFFQSGKALVCFDKGIVRIEQVKHLALFRYCTPYTGDWASFQETFLDGMEQNIRDADSIMTTMGISLHWHYHKQATSTWQAATSTRQRNFTLRRPSTGHSWAFA